MKRMIIFGLYHQPLYSSLSFENKSLAGKLIVIGSLVLGLLKPVNFLRLFLKERRVRRVEESNRAFKVVLSF